MSELTKEYFERVVADLATKQDLAPLATKQDVQEGVEELARITSGGFAHTEDRFDELEKRLDITAQLKTFELKFRKLEEAFHITL
jgi:hypothetical protein